MSEDIDRLLDKIETLEQEVATLKALDWPAIEAALNVALGEPVCPQFSERFEKVREIVRGINKCSPN